jgi:geranylgeranyl pyrophosphate synthase
MQRAEEFGCLVGLIFQFADDYLDVVGNEQVIGKTTGKDLYSDKLTAVRFYGIDGVKNHISLYLKQAENIAKSIDKTGFLQCFLHSITDWIYEN